MSLRAPPRKESPSRAVGRILVLLILAAGAGAAIYTAVTIQRAGLVEDRRTAALDLQDTSTVGGVRLNVVEDEGGPVPVVILHGVDVTGGLTLGDLSSSLGSEYRGVRIDLPGFGYSDRMPQVGQLHTVAGMAETVAAVIDERFSAPVPVIGVGHGGEVAAELAHSYPNLISGLVMVDVDFWSPPTLEASLEKLPWVGKAATYTWETGGRYSLDAWAPHCEMGGWCPSESQLSERAGIVKLVDTTNSLWSFRRTEAAALAPANLGEITVPSAYVWSVDGVVDKETVDRMVEEMANLSTFESSSFAAQLEDPTVVGQALASVSG